MRNPTLWVITSALALLALLALNGCNLKSAVKVDVPPGVADALQLDIPARLVQADQIAADWESYVERNTKALGIAISDAEDRYVALRSISDLGLQAAAGATQTLPGGALLLSGLTLLGGLFIPKPGSQAQLRQEKEDSYNAGLERGQELQK
tara:strand:- start:4604 stop:5056 length:453 start_codon:yes stop_codon:yes gene_type:complete